MPTVIAHHDVKDTEHWLASGTDGAIQAIVTLWAMVSINSNEPTWFWLTGIAMMVPAAWFGGRLRR